MIYYDEVKVSFERESLKQIKEICQKIDMPVSHFIKQSVAYGLEKLQKESAEKVKHENV